MYSVRVYSVVQACRNPGILESRIRARCDVRSQSHICRQFSYICKQFIHMPKVSESIVSIWNTAVPAFRGFCKSYTVYTNNSTKQIYTCTVQSLIKCRLKSESYRSLNQKVFKSENENFPI